MRRATLAAATAAALVLAGCGDDGGGDGAGGDATTDTTQDADMEQRPDPAASLPDDGSAPPDELVTVDVVEGDGAEATPGSQVSVHYVGVAWSTGEEFDASWDRGPFDFTLGAGQVIPGWDQGVEGMREGGRRRLTIPPELAYGDQGAAGVIAPGETLVFVVDLLEVND
nr:FKBP-type peptidyl-prolyl cis-trans isomerase [Egicoccus halophilus]